MTTTICFCDREFKNLYFPCKLKSAVFYFYELNFENVLFFHKKVFENFSPFFHDSIFAVNNTPNIILIWFH